MLISSLNLLFYFIFLLLRGSNRNIQRITVFDLIHPLKVKIIEKIFSRWFVANVILTLDTKRTFHQNNPTPNAPPREQLNFFYQMFQRKFGFGDFDIRSYLTIWASQKALHFHGLNILWRGKNFSIFLELPQISCVLCNHGQPCGITTH